jgi:hypothetical protein
MALERSIGMVRSRPNGPELLLDWIHMGVASSGLAVYDVPVTKDREPEGKPP